MKVWHHHGSSWISHRRVRMYTSNTVSKRHSPVLGSPQRTHYHSFEAFSWETMDGTQTKKKKTYFARNQLVNPVMPILCDVYPELMLPAEHLWPWEPRSCRLGMPRQPEQRAHLAGRCVPWVPLDPPSAILCLTTLLLNGIIAIASM